MRIWLPLSIAAAMLLIETSAGGPTSAQQVVEPEEVSAEDAAPKVLRGSAIAPRPAPAPMDPARWQVVAGDELWLVDTAAGEAVTCRLRNTSKVGVRVVRCFTGDLPRRVSD